MRLFALNTITCGVTVLLLAVLALPAKRTLDRGRSSAPRPHPPPTAASPITGLEHPRRVFGVYVDPWHVDDWARAIGAAPQATAKFEAFSRTATLDEYAPRAGARASGG